MIDDWKLWQGAQPRTTDSNLRRYGLALLFAATAAVLTYLRPSLTHTFFPFLAAVVLSALFGGLGPAFLATAFSSLLIRFFFVKPQLALFYGSDTDGMERMGLFVLTSLMIGALTAALRCERNLFRDSEERYRILADSATDAIVVIDEYGVIRLVSAGAERILGAPGHEMLGKAFATLLPDNFSQPQMAELKSRFELCKQAVAMELPAQLINGKNILLEMTFGAVSRQGRRLFTAIIREIAVRPQARAALG